MTSLLVFTVYLRSRRLEVLGGGGLGAAVAAWALGRASIGVPSLRALDHLQLPLAALLPLALAVLVATLGHSPTAELEATFPIRHRLLRLGYLLTATLIVALALSTLTLTSAGYAYAEALRNFLGILGLALLGGTVAGATISWLLPTAFILAATVLARGPDGQLAPWAWTVQPAGSLVALALGSACAAVGMLAYVLRGPPRDSADLEV